MHAPGAPLIYIVNANYYINILMPMVIIMVGKERNRLDYSLLVGILSIGRPHLAFASSMLIAFGSVSLASYVATR